MKRQEMAFDPFVLLDKKDRKQLTRRSDQMGLAYLVGHFAAIGVGVGVIYLTYGTILMLPAMLAQGIVLACLFAPMHECSHGTAFRTRALNEAAYWLVSLVYISQPTWYRYRHAVHHTYTQIQGKDPAMVLPGPTTWQHYFEQLLGWRFWTTFPVAITKHALGSMRKQDSWYIPKSDLPRIYNEARIMIGCYAGRRRRRDLFRQLRSAGVLAAAAHDGRAAAARLAHRRAQGLRRRPGRAHQYALDQGQSASCGRCAGTCPITPSTMSFRRRRSLRCRR